MGSITKLNFIRAAMAASFATIAWICLAGAAKADWTGCYIGANVGATAAILPADFGGFATIDALGAEGASGGLSIGCDKQFDKVVVGVWGDYTWHGSEFSITSPFAPADIARISVDDQWAIGGRAGYLVTPDVLAYGLVGYTQVSTSSLAVPVFATSFAVPDFSGVIVGGGAEIALGSGWSLDARYTYTSLDSETIDLGGLGLRLDPSIHTARVGIAYRLNPDLTR
jgi:outer membrane immunogenic protein